MSIEFSSEPGKCVNVAGNRNLRRKIFDIRRVALFLTTVALSGRFGDSIARQPNPWPEIQISAGIIGVQATKRIPFMR
jgi:hypothetical protein